MPAPKASPRFQLISGLLLLFFTACPTPPKRVEKITPLTPAMTEPAPLNPVVIEEPALVIAPPRQPAGFEAKPAFGTTNAPARAKVLRAEDPHEVHPGTVESAIPPALQTQSYFKGLTPVQDWLKEFQPAATLSQADQNVFNLAAQQGRVMLTLGSRFAKWNGVNFGLGFPPAIRQGKLCLHALDLEKSLRPLIMPQAAKQSRVRTVVIDPGHGGDNYGTKSWGSKYYEKDLTLDWALRVQKALAGSNWKVVLTRTNDVQVDLFNRVALADAVQADLFISLHFNAGSSGNQQGPEAGMETYCLTPTGLPSTLIREFGDDPNEILPNNAFDQENFLYAARIQRNLVQLTGRRDRGVRRARFMTVLREQKRPAVLVEGGFLSNPAEAQLINDPAFRQQLALAVRKSLVN